MNENKSLVLSDVVQVTSNILEHKRNGSNYLEYSKTITLCLRSIDKDDEIDEDIHLRMIRRRRRHG